MTQIPSTPISGPNLGPESNIDQKLRASIVEALNETYVGFLDEIMHKLKEKGLEKYARETDVLSAAIQLFYNQLNYFDDGKLVIVTSAASLEAYSSVADLLQSRLSNVKLSPVIQQGEESGSKNVSRGSVALNALKYTTEFADEPSIS